MNARNLLLRLLSLTLFALLISGYTRIYAQPRSGDWKVPTDFGEFVFTVNSEGTYIIKLITTFSNFICGGVTQNGTIISQVSPGWPISNSQFTIEKSVNPSGTIKMTINGAFTQTGDQASGTWSINVSGTICSGSWGPVMVSIEEVGGEIPERFMVAQNYPNPFNPSTTIEFALPKASFITLKIYNLLGKEVATLVSEKLRAGKHQRVWDGSGLATGVYLYRLEAGEFVQTKKLVLLR